MNIPFFLAIFTGLTIAYVILGIVASKKVKTTTDYFLAGRNLGITSITATLIATQLGGGMLLGTSQNAYEVGIYGIMYTLGITLGFFLLALGFASKMRATGASTTAELFEIKYNSPSLRKVASLISIITLSGILVAQVVASHTIFVGLNLDSHIFFILFWLLIIFYTMVGGLTAVVVTDILQVGFIIVVFGAVFLYCIYQNPASLASILSTSFGSLDPHVSIQASSLGTILIIPALFALIEQDLAQRFFAAQSKRVATVSAAYATVFMLLFALIPIYFGTQARLLGIGLSPEASPLLPVLELLTNEFVVALALCGIAAAITSTADSLLCAISSNVAQDFDFSLPYLKKLHLSQLITLIVGIVALGASYFVPQNIIDILVNSYKISVSCLLVPLVISYSYDNLNKYAATGSIVGGLAGYLFFVFYPVPFASEIGPLAVSGLGYLVGNQFRQVA